MSSDWRSAAIAPVFPAVSERSAPRPMSPTSVMSRRHAHAVTRSADGSAACADALPAPLGAAKDA